MSPSLGSLRIGRFQLKVLSSIAGTSCGNSSPRRKHLWRSPLQPPPPTLCSNSKLRLKIKLTKLFSWSSFLSPPFQLSLTFVPCDITAKEKIPCEKILLSGIFCGDAKFQRWLEDTHRLLPKLCLCSGEKQKKWFLKAEEWFNE